MTRETKLGIAFIGILLTVFTGLLVKKLTRPKTANANGAQASEVAGAPRTLPPTPPTTVQPRSDSSKPSVLDELDKNSYAHVNSALPNSSLPNYAQSSASPLSNMGQSNFGQSSAGQYESNGLKVKPNATADSPPGVLSTPKPIVDFDRYETLRETARIEKSGDRYADLAPETSPSARSYSSGYGAPAETERNGSATVQSSGALQPLEAKAADNSAYQSSVNPRVADNYRYPSTPAAQTVAAPTSQGSWERSTLTGTPTQQPSSYAAPAATSSNGYAPNNPRQAAASSGNSAWQTTAVPAASPSYSPTTPIGGTATMATAIRPQGAGANGAGREGDQYEVQPGDSFWTISEKAYGTGAYFKALYEHNRKRYKNREELTVGQVLSVPDEAVLRRTYPDLSPKPRTAVAPAQQRLVSASTRLRGPGRIYTVAEGDTLFEIARHELGKPARWGEIYELNRELLGKDFDYLRPGTELILPVSSGNSTPATATRPADSLYPR